MNKKRTFFVAFSIVLIAGIVAGYFFLSSLMNQPLGPSLAADLNSLPAAGIAPDSTSQPAGSGLAPTVEIPLQPVRTMGPPLCGDVPVRTILLSGIDYRGDNYLYGLADVIRIVRIDYTIPRVTIFTLDRDLWVEIPGIEQHYGITHGKLNQAYFYGVPAMGYYDGPAGGAGLLARTLKWNFDLTVENYVVVSMAAFVKGVDALGGIDVELPLNVDGTKGGMDYFEAGWHHLNGTQALELARIRAGYSSLFRIFNQDIIIQALAEKISSPAVILKAPALLNALSGTVLTDLSPSQLNDMLCLLGKMDSSNLSFAEIPTSYYVQSTTYDPAMKKEVFVWDVDFNVIRAYVREFQSGRWP